MIDITDHGTSLDPGKLIDQKHLVKPAAFAHQHPRLHHTPGAEKDAVLRLRGPVEAASKRGQMLGLDLVWRIFDAHAMYVEVGSLIRRWSPFLVHRRRHCCRVLTTNLLGQMRYDDVRRHRAKPTE